MKLILSCEETARLLSLKLDCGISRWEWIALRFHLLACRKCEEFGSYLSELQQLVLEQGRQLFEPSEAQLPDDAIDRIANSLKEYSGPAVS